MAASIEEIQARVLQLAAADRAALVGVIVKSLTPDQDIMNAWLDEAERRDREMKEDPSVGIPMQDVLRKARAALS